MFKMNAMRCLVIIKYNDKDLSADLQQYLKNVSYTDNMSGEADDLQLTLEDKAGLWQSAWMPEKGATLDVSVKLINWQSIGLSQQQQQISQLRQELQTAKSSLASSGKIIDEQNKSLMSLSAELKQEQRRTRRIERQRLLWQIVAGSAVVYMVLKE